MALVTNATCVCGALATKVTYREWSLTMFLCGTNVWNCSGEAATVAVVLSLFGGIAAFIGNRVCKKFPLILTEVKANISE